MSVPVIQNLSQALADLHSADEIKQIASQALKSGLEPYVVLRDGLAKGMEIVGARYESREYFISELIYAAYLMKEATSVLEPLLQSESRSRVGKIVIGTVKGDLHDIGKNIVVAVLKSGGLEVIDLGVDVSANVFVEKVKELCPDVLGLSALLTSTISEMKNVIEALKIAGLRDRVKVIVGGRPVTRDFAEQIGADLYARDAMEAVRAVQKLLSDSHGG